MKTYVPNEEINKKLNVERVKKAAVLKSIQSNGYATVYQQHRLLEIETTIEMLKQQRNQLKAEQKLDEDELKLQKKEYDRLRYLRRSGQM